VRIGRGGENQVVLADPKVSRQHGELRVRRGTLVYRDLGSTNGSLVNGTKISEMAVGLGDRIEVGDTTIVVESAT
jgi:pSer/pThr/pTyr-binding forkhead associated (FHA) protein